MAGPVDLATTLGDRIATNVSTSFGSLTVQQWIRLVAVVGAYLLLRPYIIKLGGRAQMKQHEADEKEASDEAAAVAAGERAPLSPNDLRGSGGSTATAKVKVPIPADSDDDSEDGQGAAGSVASGADWGKNARRRQRKMLRQLLAAHEKKLAEEQEDEEDKDIQEFLVDE